MNGTDDRGFGGPGQGFDGPGGPSARRGFHKGSRKSCKMGPAPNIFIGGMFVLIGTLLLLDRLQILDASAVLSFWPAVMVAIGLGMLVTGRRKSMPGGVVLVSIGSIFLARKLGLTEMGMRELWPVILIAVGLVVLLNSLLSRRQLPTVDQTERGSQDVLNDSAVFGGVEKRVLSDNFRGGEVLAVFGGVAVDLRKAKLATNGPSVLNATAIFGGVELKVPDDWVVVNEGAAVLGGFADSRKFIEIDETRAAGSQQMLIIRGLAMFGGVEVKN